MEKNNYIDEFVEQIQQNEDDNIRECIESWFERIRNQSMKIGASYISVAIFGIIQNHTKKKSGAKASLRDYQRMTDEVIRIISVQLNTQQNDLEENENDGTTESDDHTNS